MNVIYEDNHILVVEKPCNVASQGDETGDKDMITLCKEYVKENYNMKSPYETYGISKEDFV